MSDSPSVTLAPALQEYRRVVFVRHHVNLNTGGLTKAWMRRIRLFAAAGWDVHVAFLTRDPKLGEKLRILREDGQLPQSVVIHRYWRDPLGGADYVSRRVLRRSRNRIPAWLDRVASNEGALVFADSPAAFPLLARMRNPRVALAYVIHLSHLTTAATRRKTRAEVAEGPLTKSFAPLQHSTIRAADRIVVLTEAQKEDFLLRWGRDLHVEVIPHCADVPPNPAPTVYDPRLVIVLGRLAPTKRWDDAINAMAQVIQEVPDARLVIYGTGEAQPQLEQLVDELDLRGAVTFAGYTTSPREVMASAACVINTTRREALSLTLLECLSVGTPAVTYDIRYGPREVVRDGVDGFVLRVHDVAGSAQAVIQLLTEPGLRDRMSASAREVTTRFSRETHDDAWLALGSDLYEHRGAVVRDIPQVMAGSPSGYAPHIADWLA